MCGCFYMCASERARERASQRQEETDTDREAGSQVGRQKDSHRRGSAGETDKATATVESAAERRQTCFTSLNI